MPIYDNAWVRALEEKRRFKKPEVDLSISDESGNTSLMSDEELYGTPGDDPVAKAKQFLAGPSVTKSNRGMGEAESLIAAGVQRQKALEREAANEAMAHPYQASLGALRQFASNSRPSLEALTGPLARVGQGAQVASLPAAFVPGGQGVAAGLGIGGTALQVPDMLRRALNNDPSDDPDVGEGAFALLGMAPGMKGFRGAARGFRSSPGARGPFSPVTPQPRTAPIPAQAAPATLPTSWQALVDRINPAPAAPKGPSADWLQTVRDQGRTVPYTQEGRARMGGAADEDAWSALRTLMTRSEGKGNVGQPTGSIEDLVMGSMKGPGVDLTQELNQLSGLDRAAQQARAQQRFGRVFRSE